MLDKAFGELAEAIQRVLGGGTCHGLHVLGSNADTLSLQIGANASSEDSITTPFTTA